ncbi:cold-shock protein [Kitasatospora sp. NPDC088160]|uniref:cold-shock protein n=1 Tax=Kitasatospora sp. NPDC088160 TaxID=3364072 RepID=UPI003807BED5
MATGAVKWYDSEKGYGFIAVDPEQELPLNFTGDLFFHYTALPGSWKPEGGKRVAFDIEDGNKGIQAKRIGPEY